MDGAIDLLDAGSALDLANIRYQLIRLEDTIIFHLIERVQFPLNATIYTPSAIRIPSHTGSFLDWILHQQETIHAQVRRYQAPDEYAFFPSSLPPPLLAPLKYPVVILHPNTVNLNDKLKHSYINHILPAACAVADDRGEESENYGSTAVCDVACLQALSRRIHFGKFVAEAKYRADPEAFAGWIRRRDVAALERAITDVEVERQVLKRLEVKARTYGRDPAVEAGGEAGGEGQGGKINVQAVVEMYRDYVIPQTKEVEIEYLLQRLEGVE